MIVSEKDREEAEKVVSAYLTSPFRPFRLPTTWRTLPVFVEAVERASIEVFRIRADAVKAERERCMAKARRFMESIGPDEQWDVNDLYASILSDDQEARRG